MRKTHTLRYRSFLIRYWQETDGGPWRGSLEDPHTGEQLPFAHLDEMLDYLKAQTDPSNFPAPNSSHSTPQGD